VNNQLSALKLANAMQDHHPLPIFSTDHYNAYVSPVMPVLSGMKIS
jgi:hypothetical protein